MLSRTLAIIFALIASALAYFYIQERQRKPAEIVREIEKTVEIPKEVIREVRVDVPRDVIKQVPVEVVREVEKPLTESQTLALDLAQRVLSAKRVYEKEDILAGMKSVRVLVLLDDDIKQVAGEETVKNRVELILRRNGIKIDPDSPDAAFIQFEGFWDKDKVQMTYSLRYGINGKAFLARDGKFRMFLTDFWADGKFGFAGSNKIQDAILRNAETAAEAVANTLLSARDKD